MAYVPFTQAERDMVGWDLNASRMPYHCTWTRKNGLRVLSVTYHVDEEVGGGLEYSWSISCKAWPFSLFSSSGLDSREEAARECLKCYEQVSALFLGTYLG